VSTRPREFFVSRPNALNMMKKLVNLTDYKFFLRNREKFLATFGKFVTI
jgi:hypothetical protein